MPAGRPAGVAGGRKHPRGLRPLHRIGALGAGLGPQALGHGPWALGGWVPGGPRASGSRAFGPIGLGALGPADLGPGPKRRAPAPAAPGRGRVATTETAGVQILSGRAEQQLPRHIRPIPAGNDKSVTDPGGKARRASVSVFPSAALLKGRSKKRPANPDSKQNQLSTRRHFRWCFYMLWVVCFGAPSEKLAQSSFFEKEQISTRRPDGGL